MLDSLFAQPLFMSALVYLMNSINDNVSHKVMPSNLALDTC